jgi:hypothetical protein
MAALKTRSVVSAAPFQPPVRPALVVAWSPTAAKRAKELTGKLIWDTEIAASHQKTESLCKKTSRKTPSSETKMTKKIGRLGRRLAIYASHLFSFAMVR